MYNKTKYIIDTYGDIIAEELNVKSIKMLTEEIQLKKIYKPIGSSIAKKFGKDTSTIISNSKAGNVKVLTDGQLCVFDTYGNERTLQSDEYEVEYEGIDTTSMGVDSNIIIRYDLHITKELEEEGIARELSRFLNQMRKNAQFSIDRRVQCIYITSDNTLYTIIEKWKTFLQQEALLDTMQYAQTLNTQGYVDIFYTHHGSVTFCLYL